MYCVYGLAEVFRPQNSLVGPKIANPLITNTQITKKIWSVTFAEGRQISQVRQLRISDLRNLFADRSPLAI